MRYLSVCSGIEAASVAWEPLGWEPAGFSEIEPFPSSVLSHHWPKVKNYGDFTTIARSAELLGEIREVDLLVGGTPCQSFSVAGLRGGLDDARGNLALEFFRLAQAVRPRWLVWENVPGVLSSGGGRDFGSILRALAELGYGWAYRVLDAQYVGGCSLHRNEFGRGPVPQRRRRVFVVAHIGGRTDRAAAVLFERESLQRNSAASGKSRKKAAAPAPAGAGERGEHTGEVAPAVTSKWAKGTGGPAGDECQNLVAVPPLAFKPGMSEKAGALFVTENVAPTLQAQNNGSTAVPAVCVTGPALGFNWQNGGGYGEAHDGLGIRGTPLVPQPLPFDTTQLTHPDNRSSPKPGDPCHTLAAGAHPPAVALQQNVGVRRLTPRECERLQGFPDGHTNVPHRGKPATDGPRYKALGNSMAVPVMHWIGRRIALLESVVPWDGSVSEVGSPKQIQTKDGVQYAFSWA